MTVPVRELALTGCLSAGTDPPTSWPQGAVLRARANAPKTAAARMAMRFGTEHARNYTRQWSR